jgi:hypothetical protein
MAKERGLLSYDGQAPSFRPYGWVGANPTTVLYTGLFGLRADHSLALTTVVPGLASPATALCASATDVSEASPSPAGGIRF